MRCDVHTFDTILDILRRGLYCDQAVRYLATSIVLSRVELARKHSSSVVDTAHRPGLP